MHQPATSQELIGPLRDPTQPIMPPHAGEAPPDHNSYPHSPSERQPSTPPRDPDTPADQSTLADSALLTIETPASLTERPPIVKRQKPKRPRHKKGDPKAPPGKDRWVWGTKQTFFEKRKDAWLVVAEQRKAGPFYTKMAKLFVLKYGYTLADDEDFEYDIDDPEDNEADVVVDENLDKAEAEFRTEYKKKLRDVRRSFTGSRGKN